MGWAKGCRIGGGKCSRVQEGRPAGVGRRIRHGVGRSRPWQLLGPNGSLEGELGVGSRAGDIYVGTKLLQGG